MKINRNKLPIKYNLEIYQEMPGFASHQDLEYMLVNVLENRGMLEKDFNPSNLWQGMRSALGTIEDLRGFLEHLANPDDPSDKIDFNVSIEKIGHDKYRLVSHRWL